MASGRKHWATRLARLTRAATLNRAGRRQLRKLLGRRMGLEWRIFGNVRRRDGSRAANRDNLNLQIAARSKNPGHVAQKLAEIASKRGIQ